MDDRQEELKHVIKQLETCDKTIKTLEATYIDLKQRYRDLAAKLSMGDYTDVMKDVGYLI